MSRGYRHDETGWLNRDRHGHLLRRDAGGAWRLDLGLRSMLRARKLLGQRVRVEGTRDAFNVLAVATIAAEDRDGTAPIARGHGSGCGRLRLTIKAWLARG